MEATGCELRSNTNKIFIEQNSKEVPDVTVSMYRFPMKMTKKNYNQNPFEVHVMQWCYQQKNFHKEKTVFIKINDSLWKHVEKNRTKCRLILVRLIYSKHLTANLFS